MNSESTQTGLAIDEIAWNYTLKMANMRYNETDEFCYDIYSKQRVGNARWIYPATITVASILSEALFKKYGHIDIPVSTPEGVMDAVGIHNERAVNRFHKRMRKAVDKHRPRD